jgi:tetratricopeptide (TPR) repeat protein
MLLALVGCVIAVAQEPAPATAPAAKAPPVPAAPPLYEQDPYDELTLDEANGSAVLKLEPVELPNRRLPANPRPADTIRVKLPDRPDEEFDVAWRNIAKLRLFEQIVLDRADELTAAGKLDEAFDHLQFVYDRDPRYPGLAAGLQGFLWRQARDAERSGKADEAALLLADLAARKADFPGLSESLARLFDERQARLIETGDYHAAREQLRTLGERFGPEVQAVAERRRGELIGLAKSAWTSARAHQQAGRLPEALADCDRALAIWPELAEARETATLVVAQYPRVAVAVDELPAPGVWNPLVVRGGTRAQRLERRQLFELTGSGAEGGDYQSPLVTTQYSEDRLRLLLTLKELGPTGPTSLDIARRLLSLADPRTPDYSPGWGAVLKRADVADLKQVSLTLAPHVRPEAWLNVDVSAGPGDAADILLQGPYVAQVRDPSVVRFLQRTGGDHAAGQPAEVVERQYADTAAALSALRRGEVSAVARVTPSLLPKARSLPEVTVQPYALPTVHVLLPNLERPLLARRTFRRALLYAIDRKTILQQDILAGQEIAGSRVLDGPFPAGASFDDPLAYGFDSSLPVRPYDPRLALALSRVALYEMRAADKLAGREETRELPELTLAHPADDLARAACRTIRAQWQAIGLKVRLVELEPNAPTTANGPYDLVYAELAVWEPVADAQRLFATGGLVRGSSYVDLALRRLATAGGWNEVRSRLREIHRLVVDDATLLPLWQTVNHLAYHKSLTGIGERPLGLYDHVENWRTEPRLPAP